MYGAFMGDALGSYLEFNHNISEISISKGIYILYLQPWKCLEEEPSNLFNLDSLPMTQKWLLICLLHSLHTILQKIFISKTNHLLSTLPNSTLHGSVQVHLILELLPELLWVRSFIYSKTINSTEALQKIFQNFTKI